MRFPLSLARSMTAYLLRKKWSGQRRFPLVMMLEPLHACNLSCAGCGRIREYADTITSRLSIDQCLDAVDECGAPIVSICGGEPLIYPEIGELVAKILAGRRHVYLCTNGTLLEKKLHGLPPNDRLFINVHLDGMEATHDQAAGREGVFAAAVDGIRAARAAGFRVCTNTTIYRQTDVNETAVLLEYLTELGVDGFMISPAYGYRAVKDADPAGAEQIFMTRQEVHEKFREARAMLRRFRLAASPIYMDFLCGHRELPCAAWANPTFNTRGWRGPCYLIADDHHGSYAELLEATDWDRLGPGNDPRCEHCLVHYSFEPSVVLLANKGLRDVVRMAVWQMT
ncbi:MAG: adenosyl-hopene transferase HpnH [Candidatus Nealsonbacteria bacterium]|nr:adenosyl-hopene transferase HpnH [Candidatus Nealsonbacteria bacterium]